MLGEMKRKGKPDPEWPAHAEPPGVMTVKELSAYLHVHPGTIYRLLKQHKIPAFRIGTGGRRFSVQSIDRWLLEQEKAGRQ